MTRFLWVLIPAALLAGLAIGYVGRGRDVRVQTVVQLVTTAPPPPARKTLTAYIEGANGTCLTNEDADHTRDTFTLRRPGNGLSGGDVVAVATSGHLVGGCNLIETFRLSPELGFFEVVDDTTDESWGPFDSHQLAAKSWQLALDY